MSMDMAPNMAAVVAYILGWLTGLIVYAMEDRNEFVRFHAIQSILVSVAFTVVYFVAIVIDPRLTTLVSLGGLAVWVLLLIKAYNWEWFSLPVIGDIAYDHSSPKQQAGPGRGPDTRPDDRRTHPGGQQPPADTRPDDRRTHPGGQQPPADTRPDDRNTPPEGQQPPPNQGSESQSRNR